MDGVEGTQRLRPHALIGHSARVAVSARHTLAALAALLPGDAVLPTPFALTDFSVLTAHGVAPERQRQHGAGVLSQKGALTHTRHRSGLRGRGDPGRGATPDTVLGARLGAPCGSAATPASRSHPRHGWPDHPAGQASCRMQGDATRALLVRVGAVGWPQTPRAAEPRRRGASRRLRHDPC